MFQEESNKGVIKGGVFLIVLCTIAIIVNNRIQYDEYIKLYTNRKLSSARIISSYYKSGKGRGHVSQGLKLEYITIRGTLCSEYALNGVDYGFVEYLVGKRLPIVYDSTGVYGFKLLLSKEDFESFGFIQPDSLRWVNEY